jgi:hypothetical protein
MGYPGLDRNLDNVQALGKKRVLITPRFQLNGVSAPTLLSDTFGGNLIRAVQGGFLLTLDTAAPDILNIGAEMEFQNPGVNPAIYNTGTTYTLGSVVVPTTAAKQTGYYYMCTVADTGAASTEPTWSTTVGGTATDAGGGTWTNMGPLPNQTRLVVGVPMPDPLTSNPKLTGAPFPTYLTQPATGTVVAIGAYMEAVTAGVNYLYVALQGGTTKSPLTTLGTTINGITVDGATTGAGVVWLCVAKLGQGNTNAGTGSSGVGSMIPIYLFSSLWTSVGQLTGLVDSGPATPGTTVADANLLSFQITVKNHTNNIG